MAAEHIGSCACGDVRFRVRGALDEPGRCNCSYCRRAWYAGHYVEVPDFTLDTPGSALGEYRFASRTAAHYFCRRCGISTFSHYDWQGQQRYSVNLACIDGYDVFGLGELPVNDGASY